MFTFSPDTTNAGINAGSTAADPTSPIAGVLYYNFTNNQLRAYIGTSWISLGAAGGATYLNELDAVTITSAVDTDVLNYDSSTSM